MPKSFETVWNNCLTVIKDNVPFQSYKTWFEPIVPVKLDNDKVLTIQVPSQFFYEWLEEHFVGLLRKTIKRELGEDARLEYRIIVENGHPGATPYTVDYPNENSGKAINQEVNMPAPPGSAIKNPFIIPGLKKVNIESQLSPKFTFDSFVEGDCNQLARAAGYAVASKPGGTSFNPLVLWGGTGLGKTHLAQAIGNQVKQTFPNKTVLYVTSDKFTNQFIDAVKNNSVNDFIHFYNMVDVLIVDDIQFFGGKAKTQDIFFHIFNHLHQANKQIILTSDRVPNDMEDVEERLLSRFKWGLTADLQTPDYETRIAILEKKMYSDGIELPKEVVEFVAFNISTNIRELEGALVSLLAQSSMNKKDVDLDLARKIIKNFVKNLTREVSVEFIQKTVCEHLGIPPEKLKEKTRKRSIVQARQISMFLSKNMTKNSLKTIGRHFGGRDHSTVIHSCSAVQDQLDTDPKFKDTVQEIEKKIRMSLG